MKQHTNESQTAKLIELGFEKPRYERLDKTLRGIDKWNNIQNNYSIGELMEMLPEFSCIYDLTNLHTMKRCWYAGHVSTLNVSADELIDALYDMCIKLKAEGVI